MGARQSRARQSRAANPGPANPGAANPGAVIKWKPQAAFNQTQSSSFLRDPVEGRNSTNSTRTLRLSDAVSATWYILAIIGIYGVIFVFRLASNILRRNESSLENTYYSNLTSELKRKGFQSKVAKCSLIIHNTAALQPQQDDPEPKGEDGRLHTGTQAVP
ncbi:small integral membrane protein 34 [Chionomys nivalis]|uniref:small integral membrane protein 34 n=1 Tax=Chionomys nivalis TaxID=269649 RepID=UPI0025998E4E|nr:small integral membrane protein 34 [Chionomys nivalis]